MEHKTEHPGMGHPASLGHKGAAVENNHKAVETFEGWFSLHTVYEIDFPKWLAFSKEERATMFEGLQSFIAELEAGYTARTSGYAMYHVTGQKGDILFWFLQPTLEDLNRVELQLKKLPIFKVFKKGSSFVSVIEQSNYRNYDMSDPRIQAKLYPLIPRKKYICFYPMKKKRDGEDNWFMTDRAERARMMRAHGAIGRTYEPELSEFTTGACGLDNWEWGITLMSNNIIQFKKIVYEMRFDEVSARFGIFGSFTVGSILEKDTLEAMFLAE